MSDICSADLVSLRSAAESSVAALKAQLESVRQSQALAAEEAAMLSANLDKVRCAGHHCGWYAQQLLCGVCCAVAAQGMYLAQHMCWSTWLNNI